MSASPRLETRARFDAEVLPHLDAAYRFARWLSRSAVDADDIVQDAVVRAFRGFEACRSADPKAWLLTIVRNCHLTATTQRQRRAHVPLPDEGDLEDGQHLIDNAPDPELVAMRRDEQASLARLLSALSEEHREILVLREIEEMSYAQIAAIANIALGTVMSRLARARDALREQWVLTGEGGSRGV